MADYFDDDKQAATKADVRRLENKICGFQEKMETVIFGADGTEGIVRKFHNLESDLYGTERGNKGLVAKVDDNHDRIKVVEKDMGRIKWTGGVATALVAGWATVKTFFKDVFG